MLSGFAAGRPLALQCGSDHLDERTWPLLQRHVEAALTLEVANTIIQPAALRYQTELAQNIASLSAIGQEVDSSTLEEVSGELKALRTGIATLRSEIDHDDADTEEKHAEHCQKGLLPAMAAVRSAADSLEGLVADGTLPGGAVAAAVARYGIDGAAPDPWST